VVLLERRGLGHRVAVLAVVRLAPSDPCLAVGHPCQEADPCLAVGHQAPSGVLPQGHQEEVPPVPEVGHPDPQVQAEGQAAMLVVPQEAVPHSQQVPAVGCIRSDQ